MFLVCRYNVLHIAKYSDTKHSPISPQLEHSVPPPLVSLPFKDAILHSQLSPPHHHQTNLPEHHMVSHLPKAHTLYKI